MAHKCLTCGKRSYNIYCYQHKPAKPIKRSTKPLTRKKRIKAIGKVQRQWFQTRKEWIQRNLPDDGYWYCHYCGKPLTINQLTLDHKTARSKDYGLRFDDTNLVPCCLFDNVRKGSLSYETYCQKYYPDLL